jgi:hypothetical protein
MFCISADLAFGVELSFSLPLLHHRLYAEENNASSFVCKSPKASRCFSLAGAINEMRKHE